MANGSPSKRAQISATALALACVIVNPGSTARALRLPSEASRRFERGQPAEQIVGHAFAGHPLKIQIAAARAVDKKNVFRRN